MTGGQSPYSYKVGDRIQSEPDFTGLGNGVYEVVVSDANDCTISESITIEGENGPSLQIESTAVSCGQANGTVQLIGSGGTTPYTYYLGDTESLSGEYSGLLGGEYIAKVVDANGCEDIQEITIEVRVFRYDNGN